jgi:hypothetical protein
MILRVKIQESLAVGWRADDDGEFVFVICRSGFEKTLGKECKTGEVLTINAQLTEI